MNYLVIDLEMCNVPKRYRDKNYKYAQEIIQVGAVLLDEEYKVIGKLNQYVHPQYGVLDHYISNLTGIQNCQLKNAPVLEDALKSMLDWLSGREYKIYAWSNSDYCQLMHEIRCKNLKEETVLNLLNPEKWIDYQQIFGERFEFARAVSLEEALICCDIKAEGRLHDGLDDAVNTAKLIEKLELDKEFIIHKYEVTASTETLNFCLGDLFAGLDLKNIA